VSSRLVQEMVEFFPGLRGLRVGLVRQVLRVNRRNDQPLIRFPHLAHQPFDFGAGVRRGLASAKRRLPAAPARALGGPALLLARSVRARARPAASSQSQARPYFERRVGDDFMAQGCRARPREGSR
jgi:hypothetical protein